MATKKPASANAPTATTKTTRRKTAADPAAVAEKAKTPAASQVTGPCADDRKAHSWTDIEETITGRNEAATAVYTVRSHRCKACGLKEDNRRWSRAVRKGEDVSKVARR